MTKYKKYSKREEIWFSVAWIVFGFDKQLLLLLFTKWQTEMR